MLKIGNIILLALLFAGCSSGPEKPDKLIPEDTYTNLLVEMQLIRSYADNAETDSTTIDSLLNEVYNKYDITATQFQQSHNYYQHFPEEQKERAAKAIDLLKMELVMESDSTSTSDSVETKN